MHYITAESKEEKHIDLKERWNPITVLAKSAKDLFDTHGQRIISFIKKNVGIYF